jgi:hypothetical protein
MHSADIKIESLPNIGYVVAKIPEDIPQEAWEVSEADLTDGVGGENNEFN